LVNFRARRPDRLFGRLDLLLGLAGRLAWRLARRPARPARRRTHPRCRHRHAVAVAALVLVAAATAAAQLRTTFTVLVQQAAATGASQGQCHQEEPTLHNVPPPLRWGIARPDAASGLPIRQIRHECYRQAKAAFFINRQKEHNRCGGGQIEERIERPGSVRGKGMNGRTPVPASARQARAFSKPGGKNRRRHLWSGAAGGILGPGASCLLRTMSCRTSSCLRTSCCSSVIMASSFFVSALPQAPTVPPWRTLFLITSSCTSNSVCSSLITFSS